MNSSAKGARLERDFEKWLRDHGWQTFRAPRAKWGRGRAKGGTDIASFGDILAWRVASKPMLVQVTTQGAVARHWRKVDASALDERLAHCGFSLAMAVWYGGRPSKHPRAIRGWRVSVYEDYSDNWTDLAPSAEAAWGCDLAG